MGFNSSQLVFAPNTGHSLKPIFLFFDFFRDSTSYMSVTTGLFSSTKSQLKTSLLYRPTGLKNRRCSALDQILMVQKFKRLIPEKIPFCIIETVPLRNYRFDFQDDGPHQQRYPDGEQFGAYFSQLVRLHQSLFTLKMSKVFLTQVDIQTQIRV